MKMIRSYTFDTGNITNPSYPKQKLKIKISDYKLIIHYVLLCRHKPNKNHIFLASQTKNNTIYTNLRFKSNGGKRGKQYKRKKKKKKEKKKRSYDL